MMTATQIETATLDELNDELAAGGMPSGETEIDSARESVMSLISEFVKPAIIAGKTIQIDRSGQGHNWKSIDASEIPFAVHNEIVCEIIDGERETGEIVASNGLNYRWS